MDDVHKQEFIKKLRNIGMSEEQRKRRNPNNIAAFDKWSSKRFKKHKKDVFALLEEAIAKEMGALTDRFCDVRDIGGFKDELRLESICREYQYKKNRNI